MLEEIEMLTKRVDEWHRNWEKANNRLAVIRTWAGQVKMPARSRVGAFAKSPTILQLILEELKRHGYTSL